MQVFSKFRDARIFAIVPPAVQELGTASGFDMELVDDTGIGHEKLVAIRNKLLGMASQDKTLAGVRPNALDDAPLLNVNIDHDKARALGLDLVSMAARTRA
jgi:HAE1 family hydrophobic/amphiphilic exporter-1/multidrug efflux pump